MSSQAASHESFLEGRFGTRVNFTRTERKLYGHDIAEIPSLVKPLIGDAIPDAVVQPQSEEEAPPSLNRRRGTHRLGWTQTVFKTPIMPPR